MRRSTVRFSIIAVCLSLAFLFSCRMGSDVEAFVEEGKKKIALSYDANGGSGSVASVTAYKAVGYTATIADGSDLSRVSYVFAGWNTAANGSETAYAAGDTVTLDRDLTLYAQWTYVERLTLSYDGNGGSGSVSSVTVYEADGFAATIAGGSGLSRRCFTFSGWNTAASGRGTAYAAGQTVTLRDDLTLYAQWTFNLMIAAGTHHSLVAVKSGGVWCWGWNNCGQVGNGGTGNVKTPTEVTGVTGVVAVGGGYECSVVLLSDGTLRAWGTNVYGQLGDGNSGTGLYSVTPVTVTALSGAAKFAQGHSTSYGIKSDGTLWAWGVDWSGALGNGSASGSLSATRVLGVNGSGYLTGVSAVSSHWLHCLALRTDGTVCAWGYNATGQVGDGTTTDVNSPLAVAGLCDIIEVAAGSNHSLALKSDGTVWAWGDDTYGQLGDGNSGTGVYGTVPVKVLGEGGSGYLTDVLAIAGGGIQSLALASDGTVWAWGGDTDGELGDGRSGTGVTSTTPVKVLGENGSGYLTDVVAIAAGARHSLALRSDGTAWAWGNNLYGKLGDGSITTRTTPVKVDWTYPE